MYAHLWTDAPPPWSYVESLLRREVYHCTPQEYDQIPAGVIMHDLEFLRIEAHVRKARERR